MLHLLYIEDQQTDQKAFFELASRLNSFHFDIATSPQEALHLQQAEAYDLILVGNSPGMKQVEQLLQAAPDIPFILLTGETEAAKLREKGYKNFAAHLSKPLQLADLAMIIQVKASGTEKEEAYDPEKKPPLLRFDFSYLESLSGGDPAFKKEMLDIFEETASREITVIEHHLNQSAYREIGHSAHKLKSNLRFMGLQDLLEETEIIEKECLLKQNKSSLKQGFIKNWLARLIKAVELVKKERSLMSIF